MDLSASIILMLDHNPIYTQVLLIKYVLCNSDDCISKILSLGHIIYFVLQDPEDYCNICQQDIVFDSW